jgi:chemotaxis protein CheD
MELILYHVKTAKASPSEFEVKLMGGGRMYPSCLTPPHYDIGQLNIEQGKALLGRYGFRIKGEHVAGRGHRKVVFDVETGRISLHHLPVSSVTGLSSQLT